jgi:DNA invertase Pin-like site-specific DNA recombinase
VAGPVRLLRDAGAVILVKANLTVADNGRPERAKVLALARARRKVDAVLVTELSRWGRCTQDLVQTLDDLLGWKVSVLAQTGLSFDLSTASGKLMRTIEESRPTARSEDQRVDATSRSCAPLMR